MPILRRLLAASLLVLVSLSVHANPQAQTIWRLLDYIAVDYAVAVADGQVISEAEYAEMVEFARSVHERMAALPSNPARPQLVDGAVRLQAAIDARQAPPEVATIARALAADLLQAYPVPLAPSSPPDLARAGALYQQNCASCHGVTGAGDGPMAAGMEPAPIDFTDRERARERSVFALYQVIEQGLEGTSMGSYAHLPAADRWALSFYIGQYAYPDELAADGRQLWETSDALRAIVPDLAALTQVTPAALAEQVGADEAAALTAYLRRQPAAVMPAPEGLLALSRERLAEGVEAYAAGDRGAARDLVLSAYLDGFEPVEPLLSARDAALMAQVEAGMARLRSGIESGAPVADVRAQAEAVKGLFDQAEEVLSPARASQLSSFVGAFTILLREGLEALLLVIAIVAFLRKAGRLEVMPYVHAGWAGALVAGVFTWLVATYLVSISGASRELTEAFAALFAAAVLLFVGIWMHGKSQAGAWQRYIQEKLSHALSKRSAWFLFLLSFVVVYREVFETVLFYAALWSQGEGGAIVAGGVAASVVLAGLAWAMLRYSRRLPIARFFAISSVLISVLAVMLAGKGIAALQEAGWLSVSVVEFPRIELLGVYPTVQGLLVQLLILVVIAVGFWLNSRRVVPAPARSPAPGT